MAVKKLLQRLGLTRKSRPCHPTRFEVAAMAVQLDACFAFLSPRAGVGPDEQYSDFCHLLLNTIAGPKAPDVWEHVVHYAKMRQETKGGDVMASLGIAATMSLDAAWNEEPDFIRGPLYIPALGELIRQAQAVAGRFASPLPPKGDWPAACATIASFLEQGRRGLSQAVRSIPRTL